MIMADGEKAVVGVAILAAVTFIGVVGYSATRGDDTRPAPAVPSATTMRTAPQGPRTVYPDCRDTTERPCVDYAEDFSWLVTEEGARIPAITVSRDPSSRPRTVTIQ